MITIAEALGKKSSVHVILRLKSKKFHRIWILKYGLKSKNYTVVKI